MLFSSLIFIYAFLPTVSILYFIPWNLKIKNFILLIFSLIFYAWGEPIFVLIMISSIIANWFFGLLVDKYRGTIKAKISIVLTCVFNLGMLFIYKYLGFTTSLLSTIFPIEVIKITLPIGISFFTFQAMSYVIDVYRDDAKVQKSVFDVGLFVSFFPQLIAGPIVRYNTIAEEINYREHHISEMAAGFKRFLVGLFKKILLANSLAVVADYAFGQISTLSASMAWFGIIAYSFQIFYDFSGYSDMAIGLAKVFGFNLEENFNYPYISKSVSEFWRRWHISLGTWFKDYLYFPLGGSRVETKGKLIRNLFIVWFLTGVWHGANVTFILWGLMYFVILIFEKLTGIPK
ncbi:MAG: MBOAT family protein, partial [Christensenellaceae bacterium]|nr:MBOAT family protein [Christensenellaceae bacterium]